MCVVYVCTSVSGGVGMWLYIISSAKNGITGSLGISNPLLREQKAILESV